MAEQPYRGTQDTLDGAARLRQAVTDVLRWRDRTRTAITLGFVAVGLGVAVAATQLLQALELRAFDASSTKLSMFAGVVAWAGTISIGKLVAGRITRARSDAAIARIAAQWQVSGDDVDREARRDKRF